MNPSKLQSICSLEIEQFHKLGVYTPCVEYRDKLGVVTESGFTFIDNGSKILGVAHLDTVRQEKRFKVNRDKKTGDLTTIESPRLDDRLGVYTLLHELPLYGIKMDILLTEDEEYSNSTAAFFEKYYPEKKYNWMVEFDRGGDDVVFYQYYDTSLSQSLQKLGYKIGHGSYSDICELGGLGCLGFNVGVGYHRYHTIDAYMQVSEYATNIDRFVQFYDLYNEEEMPFTDDAALNYYTSAYRPGHYSKGSYSSTDSKSGLWNHYYDDYCPQCGTLRSEKADFNLIDHIGMCSDCIIVKYEQSLEKQTRDSSLDLDD